MSVSIVLTGPMGSGKSTVGRFVADRLGAEFVDLDALIEGFAGRSINDIFAMDGEQEFRRMESKVLLSLSGRECIVLSTGGGAVLLPENRQAMRKIGVVVNLAASLEELVSRLSGANDRPLLNSRRSLAETVSEILEKREQYYLDCDIRIDTTGKSVEDVASELLRDVRERHQG